MALFKHSAVKYKGVSTKANGTPKGAVAGSARLGQRTPFWSAVYILYIHQSWDKKQGKRQQFPIAYAARN